MKTWYLNWSETVIWENSMSVLSQGKSCGALFGDCLQPVAPAVSCFFFSSVHVGHTASKKSEGLLLMPPMGLQQIPQQGVRVRGCLPAAALRLGTANLPWALHHQPVNFTPPRGNPWKTGSGRRKMTFEPGQGASGLIVRLLWVLAAAVDQKQWQKHLSKWDGIS